MTFIPPARLLLLLLLFAGLHATDGYAQAWFRTYSSPTGATVSQQFATAANGDYFLGTFSYGDSLTIHRVDHEGHDRWAVQALWGGTYDLAAPASGGLTLLYNVSGNTSFGIRHYDDFGAQQWETVFPTAPASALAYKADLLPDQGYLITATIGNDSLGLLRLDAGGNLLWRKAFLPAGVEAIFPRGTAYSQGTAFVIGELILNNGEHKNFFLRTDDNGTELSMAIFPVADFDLRDIKVTTDGNFVIWGLGGAGITLRKYQPNGQMVWETSYDLPALQAGGPNLSAGADGGFALIGYGLADFPGGPLFNPLVKFNADGTQAWTSKIFLPGFENASLNRAYEAVPTSDGGYLFGGQLTLSGDFGFAVKTNAKGQVFLRTVGGQVINDADGDCQLQPGETPVEGWVVRVQDLGTNGSRYSSLDQNGRYQFLLDTGTYSVTAIGPNPYWALCQVNNEFSIMNSGDSLQIDFPVHAVTVCPFLETDISTTFLRRCFDNIYQVRYCNSGTAPADNAYVRVTLDPALTYLSSGIPAMAEGNNTWRFELGTLAAGDCGSFPLNVYLDCASTVLGQTHCVEAYIYPDSICRIVSGWSGASVAVEGACQADSVLFMIRNEGSAPTSSLHYIVIEDNIIYMQDDFVLPAGDSLPVLVPANGSTWRLEAEQEPNHPASAMPSVTVEGCGTNSQGTFSMGFVSQFGENDNDPFISIDCRANIASYDPNDKMGFPAGYDDEHFIQPGQELEYLIRFQNTGTDTAFQVVVRDTLSPWLDPESVMEGASSHVGRLEIQGLGLLKWTFEAISLPDSNVNEYASHGFVKFRVRQRSDTPLGSVIHNRAAIYFDYNAPVLTNETWHTVADSFVLVQVKEPGAGGLSLAVFPNPIASGSILTMDGPLLQEGRFELMDALGRVVSAGTLQANRLELSAASGIYLLQVWEKDRLIGMAKLSVH